MRRSLPIFAGDDHGMRPAYRTEIAEALAAEAPPWRVAAATAHAFDRLAADLAAANHGGGDPPACRSGCSSCCHQRVDVTAPEVIALAMWIVAEKTAAETAALRERIAVAAEAVVALDSRAQWQKRVRCPLLGDEGRCEVYDARPLACRRAHSTSVAVCEEAFAGGVDLLIPSNPSHQENYRLATIGYFEGFAAQGRPLATYELFLALHFTLGGPEAVGAAWLAGQDPLVAAQTHDAATIEATFGGRASAAGDP